MLVLTRKAGESIICGDTTIKVLSIIGGRVRVGIDAPKETPIVRSERPGTSEEMEAWRDRQRFGDDEET